MQFNDGALPDLERFRQRKAVSLEDIAQATKIGVRYLRAIERGDYGILPGGIYNTSYIRQYARAIDYEEADLLEHYYRKTGLRPTLDSGEQAASGRKSRYDWLRLPVLRLLS
jgi:cytoskeletal protein RodZ